MRSEGGPQGTGAPGVSDLSNGDGAHLVGERDGRKGGRSRATKAGARNREPGSGGTGLGGNRSSDKEARPRHQPRPRERRAPAADPIGSAFMTEPGR